MADTNKKEYTSNLHPKGDMDTTVYPNIKSENIIDKDTTAYTAGKVPDSSLVSKSLDGISENLETTKIQVATNKKNIETLQGNYTGLQYQVNTNSSDIALTKTQVETNKTNIAKNTQDIATNTQNIENLSAVMPTDINVDANNFVVLEHDGSEVTGQKKQLQVITSNFVGKITQKNRVQSDYNHFEYDFFEGNRFYPYIKYECKEDISTKGDTKTTIVFQSTKNNNYHGPALLQISFKDRNKYSSGIQSLLEFYLHTYNSSKNTYENYTYRFPDKEGTLALTSDLDAKQSTLYRHTVLISEPTNKTAYLAFTAESVNNTPIDSIQDLIAVFNHTSIACSGLFRDGDPANSQSLLMINVGTSISDTTIATATIENNAITDFSNTSFTDTFGSTGFTITDNVTDM